MAPDSPASVRSSIASVGHLSVFNYGPNEDLNNFKSRSIPPSPSPVRSVSSIPRSRSDDANVGMYSAFTLTWLMSFLQTLNFHCFRLLKEKNST